MFPCVYTCRVYVAAYLIPPVLSCMLRPVCLQLRLEGVGLKDYHADILCTALSINTTLRCISLDNNCLTDKGVLQLLNCLKGNSALHMISVQGNKNVSKTYSQVCLQLQHFLWSQSF